MLFLKSDGNCTKTVNTREVQLDVIKKSNRLFVFDNLISARLLVVVIEYYVISN